MNKFFPIRYKNNCPWKILKLNPKIMEKILLESNVKILDKNINSYEIAFASNCAITYGSTMGYELNAHNKKTLFIDPGFRCIFLPEKGLEYIDNLRVDTYAKFNFMIKFGMKLIVM
jgi:hypothetical protein